MGKIASDATLSRAAKRDLIEVKKLLWDMTVSRNEYKDKFRAANIKIDKLEERFDILLRRSDKQ